MGRSRGGLTTKIHAGADANGMPVTLRLSAGQAYDGHSAFAMLDSLGPGNILLACKAAEGLLAMTIQDEIITLKATRRQINGMNQ